MRVQDSDSPVVGLDENMSNLKCPDCGKEIAVFGESKAEIPDFDSFAGRILG